MSNLHQQIPCCVLAPRVTISRHVHALPYATVVLDGGYQEAGESGRWSARAGDVLIHAPFSAHWNQAAPCGAKLLNLPVPFSIGRSAWGQIDDVDLVARVAERDPLEAAAALLEGWHEGRGELKDTPDLLARVLSNPDPLGINAWSLSSGVSRATTFRWFRSTYGVGPTQYRIEARARLAWQMIVKGSASLAEVAASAGYADQAHMSRGVKALTGRSPGAWRAADVLQHSYKTGLDRA